jgi:hypothetical protein
MGDIVLSEYQKQYLANRKKIIAQMEAEKEKTNYNIRMFYANNLYRVFYLGNGSRQFKRQFNNTSAVKDAYAILK